MLEAETTLFSEYIHCLVAIAKPSCIFLFSLIVNEHFPNESHTDFWDGDALVIPLFLAISRILIV